MYIGPHNRRLYRGLILVADFGPDFGRLTGPFFLPACENFGPSSEPRPDPTGRGAEGRPAEKQKSSLGSLGSLGGMGGMGGMGSRPGWEKRSWGRWARKLELGVHG